MMTRQRRQRFFIMAWVIIIGMMTLSACRQPSVLATLVPDVPTRVFAGDESLHIYNFNALPDVPTILQLRADPLNLPFMAEVRDADGNLTATLSGGENLTNAQVTLPAASGAYEVRIHTNADQLGSVQLTVTGEKSGPLDVDAKMQITPMNMVTVPQMAGVCRLMVMTAGGVLVQGQPDPTSQTIGTLLSDASITADARAGSADGSIWYRVRAANAEGWLSGAGVQVDGICDGLPIVAADNQVLAMGGPVQAQVANVPAAPFDADSYNFTVDPDSGAAFTEQVSYPNGDRIDRLWLTVSEVVQERLFTIRLICEGDAASSLRWGTPENPALGCGSAMNTTFTPELSHRNLLITMPEGGLAGLVRYRLEINPSAAEDADVFLFALYRDSGGRVGESISYPGGDTTDTFVMRVEDFGEYAPDNYRDFAVSMVCSGSNAGSLRWGSVESPAYGCDQTVMMTFDGNNIQQPIVIHLPEGSANGYLSYNLYAVPIAPVDREQYAFSVDRNVGGQFGEVLSAPVGDNTDVIVFSASNLSIMPPDNYREFVVTLVCDGAGVEQVRWGVGQKIDNGCNTSIQVPMIANMNQQTVTVSVPEGNNAYINYRLIAQPILPQTPRADASTP